MKRLIYGGSIVGALLALYGLIPSNSESKLYYKNKSNLEEVVLEKLEPKTKLNPKSEINPKKAIRNTRTYKDSIVYNSVKIDGHPLNIYNNSFDEIKETLADHCKGNCLYYSGEDGTLYESFMDYNSFYEPNTDCTGIIVKSGWVLLNKDSELSVYGINKSEETNSRPDDLIEWDCMNEK